MPTCMHCGAVCQALQGILVLEQYGAAWYAKCCEDCYAKYQRQNAAERQRRMRQKRYTGIKRLGKDG